MVEEIKKIISFGAMAPSGDNMQPWKFVLRDNEVLVYNLPERDTTLYNYKDRAAYISHGALLENISLAAPVFGLRAEILYFPDNQNKNITAKITFTQNKKFKPALFEYIDKRHTNRKPYKNTALTIEQKNALTNVFEHSDSVIIRLIENKEEIKEAALVICQSDRLIFENKTIHDFLFAHIRWTETEERAFKNGLYLKTMELKPPQIAAFKLFKKWPVMRFFNAIGFPKLAVKSNFPLYTKVSALCALLIDDTKPSTFLEVGRIFQKFWLTSTSLGLSIQPLTAIPFLARRVIEDGDKNFENYQIKLLKEGYGVLEKICKTEGKIIGLFFRLGVAEPPSGLSSRQKIEIEIKT